MHDHSFRQTGREGRNLSVDVCQPRGAGPPTQLFNEVFTDIVESEGHCPTGSEGVGTHSGRSVAGVEWPREDDTFADLHRNVARGDMGAEAYKTEW